MTKFPQPRGTQDVLPASWRRRARVLDVARARFEAAGFGRISTPTFEHTELFHRGVGEATDIVGKETYTFEDRGGRSLTLRPEGTAGVARAFVNHGMHREPLPVKLWYAASMFRYEKPQAGRLREHEQIGCELFGSALPAADVEVIATQAAIYRELGLPNLQLHLNSVGSGEARAAYRAALVDYLEPYRPELDADSVERLTTNPMRILDSKVPRTIEIVADAPRLPEYLTAADRAQLDTICMLLDGIDVPFVLDPTLVRGLDYYTSTVWEFSSNALGAQSAVGGGGRYDALVEQFGGAPTPAVGFGSGVERIVLCLEAMEAAGDSAAMDVYIGVDDPQSAAGWSRALQLATHLRDAGRRVELDLAGRSAKGQHKHAARLGARCRVLASTQSMQLVERGSFDPTELPADPAAAAHALAARPV